METNFHGDKFPWWMDFHGDKFPWWMDFRGDAFFVAEIFLGGWVLIYLLVVYLSKGRGRGSFHGDRHN